MRDAELCLAVPPTRNAHRSEPASSPLSARAPSLTWSYAARVTVAASLSHPITDAQGHDRVALSP